jgi:2-keto-3-deoxy-L-rhamnonate aldolase RhmA
MDALARHATLRRKLLERRPVLGIFVKTPALQLVEALAAVGLDFIVLDAEHAPFDARALDGCILAARSIGLPALVRTASMRAEEILQALDLGAAGVVTPHVRTREDAAAIVAAARFNGGARGLSLSHRAAGYGAFAADEFRRQSDESVIVIAQIEDREGAAAAEAIAAAPGLDGVLIGPADLAQSLGAAAGAPEIFQTIDRIAAACAACERAVGIFLPSTQNLDAFRKKAMSVFLISTDQALLQGAARALARDFAAAT